MKQVVSEARAIYEDMYFGQFSKKLADWAISKMTKKDEASGVVKPITRKSLQDVDAILRQHGIILSDKYKYTALYLYHMALADYSKSLPNDNVRAWFVQESIFDIDGCPANVLDCFVTKMCNANEPIYWEDMI